MTNLCELLFVVAEIWFSSVCSTFRVRNINTVLLLAISFFKAETCLRLMEGKRLHLAMSNSSAERLWRLGQHPKSIMLGMLWPVVHVIVYIRFENWAVCKWKRHVLWLFFKWLVEQRHILITKNGNALLTIFAPTLAILFQRNVIQ